MKRHLLATLGSLALGTTAHAASLTELLPAGALMTVETRDASGAIDRINGLVGRAVGILAPDDDAAETLGGVGELLKGAVGREAAVGVFAVGRPGRPYAPHVLAVSRVDDLSAEFFGSVMKARPGARVGVYTFARQGRAYAGMAGGLVYASTDKDLLMAYLGRLSGKAAPTLQGSAAYAGARRPVGAQEFALYMNFSAAAKVVRSQLARVALPRVLSPLVDALDTLGQYAAGFTTTAGGLTAASAHAVNAQGRDRPLYRMLTHSTDFHVQDVIPASAEAVAVTACAPESGAYAARWLSRVDLIDPFGFLTDSQLADHLTRGGAYLGDECAQVILAGGLRAGLDPTDPLAAARSSVTYHAVRDVAAARAHLPEYAAAVNAAVAGLAPALRDVVAAADDRTGSLRRALPGELRDMVGGGRGALEDSMAQLEAALGGLKMVYGFRGNYVVTAWSEEALRAALDDTVPVLGQDPAFNAAALPARGAGWTYRPAPADLSPEDLRAVLESAAGAAAEEGGEDDGPQPLTEEEAAMQAAIDALGPQAQGGEEDGGDGSVGDLTAGVVEIVTDVVNRFDGASGSRRVQGSVVLGKSSVAYRWE